jgi:hypothetical protein
VAGMPENTKLEMSSSLTLMDKFLRTQGQHQDQQSLAQA